MILTNWGYTLTGVDTLPDILTEDEFNIMTANKFAGDVRIASELKASQSGIRSYVGWHLAGNLACECKYRGMDKRISLTKGGAVIQVQLPARYVTDVDNITVDGNVVEKYYIESNGVLHIANVGIVSDWSEIVIDYQAGLSDAMAEAIKELMAHHVTHSLSNSYGIQSESSGGVSVTYSAAWIQNVMSSKLSDSDKEILAPYRLEGMF